MLVGLAYNEILPAQSKHPMGILGGGTLLDNCVDPLKMRFIKFVRLERITSTMISIYDYVPAGFMPLSISV
jgi:hypothetical protein